MKCSKHSGEAIGVCAYCGRAVCNACVKTTDARLACSAECSTALVDGEKAIRQLLLKSAQSARASAFYCYLTGALSAAAAVGAWFLLPSPFLILFTGGCAAVLFASGIWYSITAGKQL
jgi:hypothetical protein